MPLKLTTTADPVYIGIDPGASGGLAMIHRGTLVRCSPMPRTERDIWDWFDYEGKDQPTYAVLEKVHAMPGNGVSSMFKFGRNTGLLTGFLIAARIPFEEVTPQRWLKGLSIPNRSKTESKTDWKNRLKSLAQRLFPQAKVTLATADAILIAEFARRQGHQ